MTDTRIHVDNAASLIALAVLAMCAVTFAHEALGHGGTCLTVGGHITQLTSSLFQCDAHSRWISPAGPLMNLACGTLALVLRRRRTWNPAFNVFLIFVTAFAWFWEGGYCVLAMIQRDGDLYFAGQDFFGAPESPWRVAGVVLGLALYAGNARLTTAALLQHFGNVGRARRASRWAWLGATLAATAAAAAYPGPGLLHDLHDAFFEIGVASLPLLWLPGSKSAQASGSGTPVAFNQGLGLLAILVYAAFVLTLGHGLKSI